MPDWGAIFEYRANYCGVTCRSCWAGSPALLSCFRKYSRLSSANYDYRILRLNRRTFTDYQVENDLHSCVPVWNTVATCWNMFWHARSNDGSRTSRLSVCRLDCRAVDVLCDSVSIVCYKVTRRETQTTPVIYNLNAHSNYWSNYQPPPPPQLLALFLGPPGWAGARRELLDFMVQGKINRGRHTDHLVGRQSILPSLPRYFTVTLTFVKQA